MGIKQPECEGKGCCWRPLENGSKAPWCFFPAKKGTFNQLLIFKDFIKKYISSLGEDSVFLWSFIEMIYPFKMSD